MKIFFLFFFLFFKRLVEGREFSKFSPLNKQTFPHGSFHVSEMNLLHVMGNILAEERENFCNASVHLTSFFSLLDGCASISQHKLKQ